MIGFYEFDSKSSKSAFYLTPVHVFQDICKFVHFDFFLNTSKYRDQNYGIVRRRLDLSLDIIPLMYEFSTKTFLSKDY